MSVALTYLTNLTVSEELPNNTDSFAAASNRTVSHTNFNKSATLSASTSPAATKVAAFQQALTVGAATIDLTALVGTNGAAVTGATLKVQAVKFSAPATNANAITVTAGAVNGYDLAGTGWSVELKPGMEVVLFGNNATPAIGASDCAIDLAGTGSQVLNCIIVMG